MLAIDTASSGGSKIPIREPDAMTPMRKPDADLSSWRFQRTHTPDGLADFPGNGVPPSRKLMFRYRLRRWPLTRRPLAGAQTPRRRCVSQTPIRRRGAFSGPTPLMAWRTPPGTGQSNLHYRLCSGSESEAPGDPASSGSLSLGQTPIREPDADPSSGAHSGSTPLMAWRTSPGTGYSRAESLCSDIDSDANSLRSDIYPMAIWIRRCSGSET